LSSFAVRIFPQTVIPTEIINLFILFFGVLWLHAMERNKGIECSAATTLSCRGAV
jgi:hypothetical protein